MKQKVKKPAAPAQPAPAQPAPAQAPSQPAALVNPVPAQPQPVAQPAQPVPVNPSPPQAQNVSNVQQPAMGQPGAQAPNPDDAATLMGITGKPLETCNQALMVAKGQVDVAAELLLSGQFEIMMAQAQQQAAGGGGAGGMPGGNLGQQPPMGGAGAGGGGNPLAGLSPQVVQQIQALVSNPQFPMIAQQMATSPEFAQQFMQGLQQTQPEVFQAIVANPQVLSAIITQALGGGGAGGAGGMGGMGAGGAGAGSGSGGPPPGTIQLTPQEAQDIEQLHQMLQISKMECAQAYMACDKNMELAMNFLMDNGGAGMGGAGGVEDDLAQALAASAQESQPAQAQPAQPAPEQNQAQAQAQQPAAQEQPAQEQQPEGGNEGGAGGSSLLDDNNQGEGDGAGGSGSGAAN